MLKKLLRICLIGFCFLISGISNTHAFTVQHTSQSSIISSEIIVIKKTSTNTIVALSGVLYNPSSITNNFDAVEEVIEEDEDTECASFKKHSDSNTQFYISQKAFQKAGAYHFYSAKSWQPQAPIVASTSTSKSILFCVFRI